MKRVDLSGRQFGRLIVLGFSHVHKGVCINLCKCECGNEKLIRSPDLISKKTLSCGCLGRSSRLASLTTHGHSVDTDTPEYMTWKNMKARCLNPRRKDFPNYGGRGIGICDKWKNDFSSFISDVGNRPSPHMTLDRIDNSKGYEPGNVRWATRLEQNLNTRSNRLLELGGVRMTITQWSRHTGITSATIRRRLKFAPVSVALTPGRVFIKQFVNDL